MSQYCGLATRENRIKWAVFATFIIVGFVFFFVYLSVFAECYEVYYNDVTDIKYDNSEECGARYGYLMWLAIICWIICSIPLYVMCCCTKKPSMLHSAWAQMENQEETQLAYPAYTPPSNLGLLGTNQKS
eukprot:TRINITY_DN857_c0_g1_i1.p2 TRINITY_DN857_c0_g1~~TRINITY_DN857_c0_g1_i1.p2  ORF type:complete len:130 (-),score=5.39 TRINITY_DN857_c0_g1_i1:302-691(-)